MPILDSSWPEIQNSACTINPDPKTDPNSNHETISVASRPLDILNVGLMNDATV
jgi:hypothetical protein